MLQLDTLVCPLSKALKQRYQNLNKLNVRTKKEPVLTYFTSIVTSEEENKTSKKYFAVVYPGLAHPATLYIFSLLQHQSLL